MNIWAYRNDTGTWLNPQGSGWDEQFEIKEGWPEIIETLGALNLRGNVDKLAIVAHGDEGGLVQLKPDFTPSMVTAFRTEIAQLGQYLTPNGRLIFCACVAGACGLHGTDPGGDLLNRVSTLIPNRYVIGFEVQAFLAAVGQPNRTGMLRVSSQRVALKANTICDDKGSLFLTEKSWFSKWSLNGRVVQLPMIEQGSRPNNRCATPGCIGHGKPTDRCRTYG